MESGYCEIQVASGMMRLQGAWEEKGKLLLKSRLLLSEVCPTANAGLPFVTVSRQRVCAWAELTGYA
eukprot:4924739-Karenia_brevis.AAC.1